MVTLFSHLLKRSLYHYVGLSEEAEKKYTFIAPVAKYKFKKVPFWLAKALAYFPQMFNHILHDFPFAFGDLDDKMKFS